MKKPQRKRIVKVEEKVLGLIPPVAWAWETFKNVVDSEQVFGRKTIGAKELKNVLNEIATADVGYYEGVMGNYVLTVGKEPVTDFPTVEKVKEAVKGYKEKLNELREYAEEL